MTDARRIFLASGLDKRYSARLGALVNVNDRKGDPALATRQCTWRIVAHLLSFRMCRRAGYVDPRLDRMASFKQVWTRFFLSRCG